MRSLCRFLLALSAFATVVAAQAQVKLNVTANAKDGVLRGEAVFTVTVESKDLVTQVEFYMGEDLRDSDTSTPYEFRIDTLAETEGPLDVRFVAYTENGERGEAKLKLRIDNELGKGADFHVAKGREALTDSKWDEAILCGRVALKAKPGYAPARLVMARANFGKGVFDAAQKFAEDVIAGEPENLEALDLLSAINLKRAFVTFARSSDAAESVNLVKAAMRQAAESRGKSLAARLESMRPVADGNRVAFAELAIQAGRFSLAIEALNPAYRADTREPKYAGRLAYAQLRAGRTRDAYATLQQHMKGGAADGATNALMAVFSELRGEGQKAFEFEREAILAGSGDPMVRTAQAWLALRRANSAALGRLAAELAKEQGERPEANYYLTAAYNQAGDLASSGDAFERAVLAEPAAYDLYIERANQSLALTIRPGASADDKKNQYAVARAFFEAAQAAKPESFEALTGLALVSVFEGKAAEAVRSALAAVAAGPEYPAARYALAAAYGPANSAQAAKALAEAGKLDPANLEGRSIPNAVEAWRYFSRYGRMPFLAAPGG